jgi:signal transduction histidine kinase
LIRRWVSERTADARAEADMLVVVVAVVLLMTVFRQTVVAGIVEDVPSAAEFAGSVWTDFTQHLFSAMLMLVLIQPARRLGPAAGARRFVVIAAAVLLGAALAATVRILWISVYEDQVDLSGWPSIFTRFALVAGLLVVVGEFHRAEVRSLEAMRAADANRAALEQQTLQARVKTLEAQIEPHFLFNTLATVRRLYETDAAAGEGMLERLMRYLEVALPSMRSEHSTLEREATLIESYLELQRVRMGRRLAYGLDIPPALRRLEVPPMMLLTLVENAIKHGLAPQREGGRVDVRARLDGESLLLVVADTGRGFGSETSGGGTGLANIRARLAAMFGPAAQLMLTPNEPRGIQATIRMPRPAPATA